MNAYHDVHLLPAEPCARALVWYPSLGALVRASQGPCDLADHQRTSRNRGPDRTRWTGTETIEDAWRLALNGWTEGTARMADFAQRLHERVTRSVPVAGLELADEGGEVEVAAYLAGADACMWSWRDPTPRRRGIKVTVNVALPAFVHPDRYVVSGALVTALVDALEHVGREVELEAYMSVRSQGGEHDLVLGCRLKEADTPLDRGAVAFALAHPSMLRRVLFSLEERAPQAWRARFNIHRGGGYGASTNLDPELRGDVHVDLLEVANRKDEEGYDWVLAHLAEQGVAIEGSA